MESFNELQKSKGVSKERNNFTKDEDEIKVLEEEPITDNQNIKGEIIHDFGLEETNNEKKGWKNYIETITKSKFNIFILFSLTNIPIISSVCYIFAITEMIGLQFAIPFVFVTVIFCLIRTFLLLTDRKALANICSGVNISSLFFILIYFGKTFSNSLPQAVFGRILFYISYLINIVSILPIDMFMISKYESLFCLEIIFFVPIFPSIFFVVFKKYVTMAMYLLCFYSCLIIYFLLGKKTKKFLILFDFLFFMFIIFFTDTIYYSKIMNLQSSNVTTTSKNI